jgi:hypothetical protein
MKLVPKPDGYELRAKRADKNDSAKEWTAADTLYHAQQHMQNAECCIVTWYERVPDAGVKLKYWVSQTYDRQSVALAADLLADLTS